MADFRNVIAFNRSLKPALQQSVVIALSSGRAILDRRIFFNGQDSNNAKIGQYKNKSYREYRERRGRQTAFVDLRLEGFLQNSIQVIRINPNETGIGFINDFEADKAQFNEDRYEKDIFSFSENELNQVYDIIIDELGRIIG